MSQRGTARADEMTKREALESKREGSPRRNGEPGGGRRGISVLLALYLALGILYSVTTPLFEAGDEIWHYPYVQHLATTGQLPVQDPLNKGLWEQEGGQPPAYYALAALATAWIDTSDLPDRLWINPHAQIGIPLAFGNKNMIVHTAAEALPWQGTTLAVHLIRFLSLLLGAVTVACTYLTAREILATRSATREENTQSAEDRRVHWLSLGAGALVAFNPMFLFIMASVNNDSLAVALASLSLLWIVQLVHRPTMRRFVLLGLSLGLGALTKESDLGLGAVFGLAVMYLLWREKRKSRVLAGAVVTGMLVTAIAGWWYLRNWMLYGDPTGLNVWLAIAGPRPHPVGFGDLLGEFQGFRISFWGNLGGVNLIGPDWVYTLLDLFSALGLLGLLVGLWRKRLSPMLLIPATWVIVEIAALIRWTMMTFASQGRLVFPAISAIAVLLAVGLDALGSAGWGGLEAALEKLRGSRPRTPKPAVSPNDRRIQSPGRARDRAPVLVGSMVVCLFVFALLAPYLVIRPAYAAPPRLPADASVPNPVHIRFGEMAELVGYALPQRAVRPGESLPLTLYWRALAPMDEDYTVYIHLFDFWGRAIGQWDAFPGNGLLPTRLWQPGEIVVDTYRVPVTPDAQTQVVGRVEAGLYRKKGLANLEAFDPAGRAITPTLGEFKVAGERRAATERSFIQTFGGMIALADLDIKEKNGLEIKVTWRALQPPDRDYTQFAQVIDANGQAVSQFDGRPRGGSIPTQFWETGDVIEDSFTLALPKASDPGPFRLIMGWYDAATMSRVPSDQGGEAYVIENMPQR